MTFFERFWPFPTGPPTSRRALPGSSKPPLSKHDCLITAASAPSQTSWIPWQRGSKASRLSVCPSLFLSLFLSRGIKKRYDEERSAVCSRALLTNLNRLPPNVCICSGISFTSVGVKLHIMVCLSPTGRGWVGSPRSHSPCRWRFRAASGFGSTVTTLLSQRGLRLIAVLSCGPLQPNKIHSSNCSSPTRAFFTVGPLHFGSEPRIISGSFSPWQSGFLSHGNTSKPWTVWLFVYFSHVRLQTVNVSHVGDKRIYCFSV